MKLNKVKGDVITATSGLILHGCNAQGVMGSGVALAIRNTFPLAYQSYLKWKERVGNSLQIGNVQFVTVDPDLTIANGITQEFYGRDGRRYVSYLAIDCVFSEVKRWMSINAVQELHMPKIGSGLGGGDWNVIETNLLETFAGTNIEIYLYEM